MIERFYLKNYLSFKEVELNLKKGLIVFSGPSGSGKSILMESILGSVGLQSCDASLCESTVHWGIDSESTGIENHDVNVFKHVKKENSRYFVNNQTVSKKSMQELASKHIRHLSFKDFSDFENHNLLSILDNQIEKNKRDFVEMLHDYKNSFSEYKKLSKKLKEIQNEEKNIVELKEFTAFEIQKIEAINPSIAEDKELMKIKKELSRKEKVLECIANANSIFAYENKVSEALELIDCDNSFFDDAMNELRAILDDTYDRFNSLEDIEIEEVLDRIEELSELKRRYGSIEEALQYKEEKKLELNKYENIQNAKDEIQEKVNNLYSKVQNLSEKISNLRAKQIVGFQKELNKYLKKLYLQDATVKLKESQEYSIDGKDSVEITLNATQLNKISTGEFNRLRLAILALKAQNSKEGIGVLMLDEIDANLSGEESMSVAKVLRELAQHFQIYVISHQPQLTSMGDQHFLIHKERDQSIVKELDTVGKIHEIARIISGSNISSEAKEFAKELLEVSKCA